MPAKFRCCSNYTTAGHATDCSLKPDSTAVEEKAKEAEEEGRGCKFDILKFEHIGECQGTCGDADEGIQFETEEGGVKKIIIIMMVDLGPDPEAKLKELEERGLRRLTQDEIREIIDAEASGEFDIQIQVITLEEIEKQFPKPDEPKKEEEKEDPYLDIKEAAKALQFSKGWTRTLCRKGRLPGAIKLDRVWAIPRSAIFEED